MIYELIILNEKEEYSHTILLQDCISAIRDRMVNGYHTLTFSLFSDDDLKKDYHVLLKNTDENRWYEYIVASISQSDDRLEVVCESSFYSTLSNYVDFVKITGNTVVNGLTKILDSCTPISDWHVGRSDITGSFYMQRSKKQLKEVIYAWVEAVGGELSERIEFYDHKIVRYVDILKTVGADRGKVIYDDREIQSINMTLPTGYTYTSAFGYGASTGTDEDGNAILTNFADVSWSKERGDPCDKPLGQTWLELGNEYKEKYGLIVDGKRYHRVTIVKAGDVSDPLNLLKRTYNYLMANIQDQTQYTIVSADLKKLGYAEEEIRFGDTIRVVVSKFNDLRLVARVYRYKDDLLNPANNYFELNNFKKTFTSQINKIQNSVSDLESKVDGVSKDFHGSILDKWNQEINADSAYLMYGDPINGLSVYNANSIEAATKATRMKGGSLQIANRKENGEFVWTTLITGDGMIADSIYTGIIKGNYFDFDLDNGIVRMGKRNANGIIDNPSLLLNENGELTLKSVSQIKDTVKEIELRPTLTLESKFGTQQVYSPSSDTYTPNYQVQNQIITPVIKVKGKQQTVDSSKIVWSKLNGNFESYEQIINGSLVLTDNLVDKTTTYICTYNYAEDKSVSTEVSFSLVSDGTQGTQGKDAASCNILASSSSFISSDGITYTPENIVLTPQFQGCKYAKWQYSVNGINWSDVVNGQNGLMINSSSKELTVSRQTTLLTNQQKSLNIKLQSDIEGIASTFTIVKIKDGLNGKDGVDGTAGPKGEDGKTSYFHIKYSAVSNPTTSSQMTETPSTYIGTYVDFTQADSTDPKKYIWSRFEGEQGEKGIQGIKGTDGKTSYLHIAYANSSDGSSGFSVSDSTGKLYIGQYTDFVEADSTDYRKYSWTKIKGDTGSTGVGVRTITNYYLATSSASGVTTATSGWTTTVQSVSASKKYLWNYEKITFTNNTTTTTEPCIIGAYGDKGATGSTGATGVGIKSIAENYQVSASNTTAPTTWVTTVPNMTATNRYLWNYETITYTDGTTKDTLKRVIGVYGDKGNTGATGPAGKGIKSTAIAYAASTSGTTIPTSGWVATIPTVAAGSYLWTRTTTTYTDNSTSASYSVGKMGNTGATGPQGTPGKDGAAGKGIKSTAVTYQAAANGTTIPTGSWVANPPKTTAAKPYLWSRTIITYTDNTTSTSYSVGATPEGIVVGGRNLALRTAGTEAALLSAWNWSMETGKATEVVSEENGEKNITFTRDATAAGAWSVIFYKNILLKLLLPATEYMVSFDVYPSVATTFITSIKNGNGSSTFTNIVNTASAPANKWTRLSVKLTTLTTLPAIEQQVIYLGMSSSSGISIPGSVVKLKNLKLEQGNKDTPWTPAPEDFEQEIADVQESILEMNTKIVSTSEEIVLEALKSYTETSDFEIFKETVESQLKLMAEQMTLQFTQQQSILETVNGVLQEQITNITKYFTFDINGMTIGQTDSPNKVVIDNDEISIVVNGNKVQTFNSTGKGVIPQLEVTKEFNFFGYTITQDGSGNVNLDYTG